MPWAVMWADQKLKKFDSENIPIVSDEAHNICDYEAETWNTISIDRC